MKVAITFLCFSVLGLFLLFFTHLTINGSQSLSYHGFFCIKHVPIKRGDLVCLGLHPPFHAPTHVTKRLMGLPGDKVEIRNNHVYVANHLIGPLFSHTREGQKLTPITAQTIPECFVFLSADHPRSFDSRYQEFGLVPSSKIEGRCFGILRRRSCD